MNVCQTRFVHMVCRFDKISAFRTPGVNFREMEARKVNHFGPTYHTGVALDYEMRSLDRILQNVGDRATEYIPRAFCYFSEELKLSVNSITKKISAELSISARPKGASKWIKLTKDDRELIELMETEKPSVSLAEIISCLEEMDGVEVSMAAQFESAKAHIAITSLYEKKKSRIVHHPDELLCVIYDGMHKEKIKLLGFLKALANNGSHSIEFLVFVTCLDSYA